MKALYILRHGKSSHAVAGAADRDRPLTKQGRKAGRRIGQEIDRRGWRPEGVLCSTARRTRETWEALASSWEATGAAPMPRPIFLEALYLAPPPLILNELAAFPDDVSSVMVIGHNPGLHELATALSGKGRAALRRKLETGFPTCALAVITVSAETWAGLDPGSTRLEALVFPRELD